MEEDLRNKLPVLHEVPERRIVAKAVTGLASDADGTVNAGSGCSSPSLSATTNQLAIDLPNVTGLTSGADGITTNAVTNLPLTTDVNPGNAQTAPHHLFIEGDNLYALTVLQW